MRGKHICGKKVFTGIPLFHLLFDDVILGSNQPHIYFDILTSTDGSELFS
jgi:hypothetical protein